MRICIDIDGTICRLRKPHEDYRELKPITGAAERIKDLKNQGAYIILCTARHMKTCEANLGKVIALGSKNLVEWLHEHNFEYDELWFGKPYADIYIDDKAFKFTGNWNEIDSELIKNYL